ncbi:MAG: nitrous oxide reductase accessory protein NosL [Lentisphaerota bacterium]
MKKLIPMLLLSVTLFGATARAEAAATNQTASCPRCNMDEAKSETNLVQTLKASPEKTARKEAAATNQLAICQLCGMDAAKSDTKFVLTIKESPDMHACCMSCASRIMKKLGKDVVSVTTLDFATRKQVPAADAFYVLGSKRRPKGSMMPFVFAFGVRADADAFKDKHSGKVMTFNEILAQLNAEQKGNSK